MKKLLVFLHGAGGTKDSFADVATDLANYFYAELITFNAPIPFKNGFTYMNKVYVDGVRTPVESDYQNSLIFLKNKILSYSIDPRNIIVVGHSQGGQMATCLGMQLPFYKTISICGDFPRRFSYSVLPNHCEDILLINGARDNYLSEDRKSSYKILDDLHLNYRFVVGENIEHFSFTADDIISCLES